LFNVESNKKNLALSFLLLVVLLLAFMVVVLLLVVLLLPKGACVITPLLTKTSWEERNQTK
jgi:flagellar basal body-associated protein FliL